VPLHFTLNGAEVDAELDAAASISLLDVLREQFGIRSAKDGCSPQGQCGCCTVLVDGQARVACVTPAKRVAGRVVTTLEGLDADRRDDLAAAFAECGASQCGFCTPGILMRLSTLADPTPASVNQALLAHLCRCTGWQTIVEAATTAGFGGNSRRIPTAIASKTRLRAALEGGMPQSVGTPVALGEGGFAADTAPADALVAVPSGEGGFVTGTTLSEARRNAGKVQGRRTTMRLDHPLDLPAGDWVATLQTTWVEPAYLEPDASWCVPGGEPFSPLANGGAFGAKSSSIAPKTARRLADEHGRTVLVVLSREDTVRLGPKRPPIAGGVRADGTGIIRVARTPGIAAAIHSVAPGFEVEEVDVAGPPTSSALRAAGWAEAAILLAAARHVADTANANANANNGGTIHVVAPNGASAWARIDADGAIHVGVRCGRVLDPVVLRSYCIGAAHMGLGWVTSEGIAVDADGEVHDLTIRSFGILRAKDMPQVHIDIDTDRADTDGADGDKVDPVNGSDAVFAAVAAATWIHRGLPACWPVERGSSS